MAIFNGHGAITHIVSQMDIMRRALQTKHRATAVLLLAPLPLSMVLKHIVSQVDIVRCTLQMTA